MLSVLACLLSLVPALLLVSPGLRRAGSLLLALAALAAAVLAFLARAEIATLTVLHYAPAFVGQQIEPKGFPVGDEQAPGWQAPLLVALWLAAWSAICWRLGGRVPRPLVLPACLALGGVALVFCLQKAAAPGGNGPLPAAIPPAEVFVFPASLVAAALLAQPGKKLLVVLAWLLVFVSTTRVPVAALGAAATLHHWGTWFDVHTITFFANTLARRAIETTDPGEQIRWLILLPELGLMPLVTMCCASGIAFFTHMLHAHRAQLASR